MKHSPPVRLMVVSNSPRSLHFFVGFDPFALVAGEINGGSDEGDDDEDHTYHRCNDEPRESFGDPFDFVEEGLDRDLLYADSTWG